MMLLAKIAAHAPDSHPEWLIKLWYASPFHRFEPHLTTAVFLLVLGFALGCIIHQKRKQKQESENWQEAHNEKTFQELKAKKTIAMEKLLDTEEAYKQGELTKEEYEKQAAGYRAYLNKINRQLKDLTV